MRKRLTTDKTKIFARENITLMSVTKDELRKLYNEIFDRLQEYEIAEETGQIIVPPCKVGDKLYYICEGYVVTRIVELIKIYDYGIQLITTVGSVYEYDGTRWYNPKSNKTAYFSEEKVKQALKGGAG